MLGENLESLTKSETKENEWRKQFDNDGIDFSKNILKTKILIELVQEYENNIVKLGIYNDTKILQLSNLYKEQLESDFKLRKGDLYNKVRENFLKNNEGNVFVFDTLYPSYPGTQGHVGLYFIYQGKEYTISYHPIQSEDDLDGRDYDDGLEYEKKYGKKENSFFEGVYNNIKYQGGSNGRKEKDGVDEIDRIRDQLYGINQLKEPSYFLKRFIKIDSKDLDIEKIKEYHNKFVSEIGPSSYNRGFNNCADVARGALEKGGFFDRHEFEIVRLPIEVTKQVLDRKNAIKRKSK